MEELAGWAVSVRTPLLTVHGLTELVGAYIALMYHSCSPLPSSVPPFSGEKWNLVVQVPEAPFQRLSELKSSPKVRVAVSDRFFGSIVTSPPSFSRDDSSTNSSLSYAAEPPIRELGNKSLSQAISRSTLFRARSALTNSPKMFSRDVRSD